MACRCVRFFFCKLSRGGTCHEPRAAGRPATGTIVVPAFRRVHRCHPGPDQTSRSGAVPGNAWTHSHTDKHDPANFFSPTHRRKSSFIRTCYAKALAPFILYDFGTRGRHCLIALPWTKIVDIAMFKFNSALSFTRKAPLKDARAHVHDLPHHFVCFLKSEDTQCARALHVHIAPQHPKSCIIEKYSMNCISVPNFVLLA